MPPRLIGRGDECEAIAATLRALPGGPSAVLVITGEPGIGKSRLLDHLAASAAADGATVLGARASEFEHDLPYALWTEALERHLAQLGERRVGRLGVADPAALATVLPALGEPAIGDRHRTHRALRDLLERLAVATPLVLWMDDVHWADPASIDAIAALVRRPPAASVLLALAAREGRLPASIGFALAAADGVTTLRPPALTPAEAVELVGEAGAAIFAEAGGNPFYLEQLARVRAPSARPAGAIDGSVPPAVAAALAAELAALPSAARRILDAAAVVGDPFEPDLTAAVGELPEPEALDALDELLTGGLIRTTTVPRRFAFRHPVVRHAVYVATPPAWRLGAHARAATALQARGAGPVQRAHHVEHAARPGDEDAISVLTAAATQLQSPAPATAARFHAAALRLLPDDGEQRGGRQRRLADAQAAAGDPAGARQTLLDALQVAEPGERLTLTVALANQEWWLGGHEDARRRLQVALTELPAVPSLDRVRLRLALALTALLGCDLADAQAQAGDARDDARALGDPAFEAGALACIALASASAGTEGSDALDASAATLDRLTAEQLATRLPALWMQGRARRAVGMSEAALADLRRGAAIAEQTGRDRILLMLTVESVAALIDLGRLAEAAAAAIEGVERARLAGNPRIVLWAQSALACARLAAGDVAATLSHAEDAVRGTARADFHAAGQPGWCLGAALTAAGNADRAVPFLLEALDSALPVDRAAVAADLIEAQLAQGDLEAAEATLARVETRAGDAWAPDSGAPPGAGSPCGRAHPAPAASPP
ncbi:AAA family ATPase, partial [Solirubrobacter taibaiensis]|nr:AAA family ATPase [Solirubrobacter taibaiensis]